MGVYKLSNPGTLTAPRTMYKSMLAGNDVFRISDYDLISTNIVSAADVGGISFSSIPQTYKHLQVRLSYQANTSINNNYGLAMTLNSENSTSDNAQHILFANGSALNSRAASGVTQITHALIPYPQPSYFGGTLNPSSFQSQSVVAIIDILDYRTPSKNKTTRYFSGHNVSTSPNVSDHRDLVSRSRTKFV
jgi:hypothetical protein